MKVVTRLLQWCLVSATALVTGMLLLFVVYGFSQGRDVGSGLAHLFDIEFIADPAELNPVVEDIAWHQVSWVADIENHDLNESSGLTASNLHDDVFWSVNDSGNGPELFAIGHDGGDLGTWQVDTATPVDWESLDSFVLEGVAYLVIGDTGDNFRWRKSVSLLVVPEPVSLAPPRKKLTEAWRVTFVYPHGPTDSEAMAVDVANDVVYVLSKRLHPAQLYRLPLGTPKPVGSQIVVAQKVSELVHLPRSTRQDYDENPNARYRHTPTGMDLAQGRLLVTTYKHAYLYQLGDLQAAPVRVKLPSVGQREALTFARDRSDVAYISRERKNGRGVADLFKIEFSPLASAQKLPVAPADEQ